MKLRRLAALIALAALGCGGRLPQRALESVTPVGGGRFWASGSGGAAVFHDGKQLSIRDYPLDPDKPEWAYERGSELPSSSVVVVEGETLLFTAGGDVLSWADSGWARHDVRFPPERPDEPPLLNRVLVLPDQRLLIHVHSDLLLRASLSDLLASRFEQERAPTFFTHLEVIDGRLYALGWDESGNVRALWASSAGGWSLVVRLGVEVEQNSMRGLFMLTDGTPVAVSTAGLVPASTSPALAGIDPSIRVHRPGRPIPAARADAYISGVFSAERGHALLLLSGAAAPALIEIADSTVTAFNCRSGLPPAIGAFVHAGSWRLVDRDARPFDLRAAGCRPRPLVAR